MYLIILLYIRWVNMNARYLGNIYFIKEGQLLKKKAFVSEDNIKKQSYKGLSKALKLYSDEELDNGNKEIIDIYKRNLDDNTTIVRAYHKAISSMGEVTILDDYNVDIYIPPKVSMLDLKALQDILNNYDSTSLTITNYLDNDYDFYDYTYNYSKEERSPFKICECFYKEKNLLLDNDLREMFFKYRDFNFASFILEDYSKYLLNNRNAGVVIIMPDLIVKKSVTKSFHKDEILDVLKRFYQINSTSYIDLVNDYNLVIGFITNDIISCYVSDSINDYQRNELSLLIKDSNDLKLLKPDLITSANVIKDRKVVFDGELSEVSSYFSLKEITK